MYDVDGHDVIDQEEMSKIVQGYHHQYIEYWDVLLLLLLLLCQVFTSSQSHIKGGTGQLKIIRLGAIF